MYRLTKSIRPPVPDYFRDYKTREWKTYELSSEEWETQAPALRSVDIDSEIICCHSDSEKAEIIGADPRRFYFDLESIEAGIDPVRGCDVECLTISWRGHRAGSLVLYFIHAPTLEELEATNYTATITRTLAVEI